MNDIIKKIELDQMNKEVPTFGPGDTVRVMNKIIEGDKERVQPYEGIVIKRQGGKSRETFTVRKLVDGVGVEKTFPIYSPMIKEIQVVKRGKVRRAKLYYLRKKLGTEATRVEDQTKESWIGKLGIKLPWSKHKEKVQEQTESVKT
jgi:large subunit ribosomal protein L19